MEMIDLIAARLEKIAPQRGTLQKERIFLSRRAAKRLRKEERLRGQIWDWDREDIFNALVMCQAPPPTKEYQDSSKCIFTLFGRPCETDPCQRKLLKIEVTK